MMTSESFPCLANNYVPHQPPILCVDKILDIQGTSKALIEATVPGEGPFFGSDGIIPEYFIELLAQAIAAAEGFRHKKSNLLKHRGMLASIDKFAIYKQANPGNKLLIKLQKTMEFGSFIIVEGRVLQEECLLAEGCFKIWHQDQKEDAKS